MESQSWKHEYINEMKKNLTNLKDVQKWKDLKIFLFIEQKKIGLSLK